MVVQVKRNENIFFFIFYPPFFSLFYMKKLKLKTSMTFDVKILEKFQLKFEISRCFLWHPHFIWCIIKVDENCDWLELEDMHEIY